MQVFSGNLDLEQSLCGRSQNQLQIINNSLGKDHAVRVTNHVIQIIRGIASISPG